MKETNKRFAELAGICWHELKFNNDLDICARCSCGKEFRWLPFAYEHEITANPNFCPNPLLVLEVMLKRADWPKFISWLFDEYVAFEQVPFWIERYILDKTGKLAIKAIEWMEKEAGR
jgi:hypothetical protein